jgi:hypothetical protein
VAAILTLCAGLLIGAQFGAFRLIATAAVICTAAFCIGLSSGLELACIRAAQMWFCLTTGFVLAVVSSWLVAKAAPRLPFLRSERSRRI